MSEMNYNWQIKSGRMCYFCCLTAKECIGCFLRCSYSLLINYSAVLYHPYHPNLKKRKQNPATCFTF